MRPGIAGWMRKFRWASSAGRGNQAPAAFRGSFLIRAPSPSDHFTELMTQDGRFTPWIIPLIRVQILISNLQSNLNIETRNTESEPAEAEDSAPSRGTRPVLALQFLQRATFRLHRDSQWR